MLPKPVVPPLYLIRNRQVILDSDLAHLFGIQTRRLNEQIRRNRNRFPDDFAFLLSAGEAKCLMSQFATSKGRGGRRKLPYVLTEHGVVMAANVLSSPRAVVMSVAVVRAFVRLRKAAQADGALKKKMSQLEIAVKARLERHDADIERLFKTVESLIDGGAVETSDAIRRIGFIP